MNRRGAALALAALLLAGCAGVPRSITLSEAELQAQLARRFPLQRSVLDSIELQLSDPVLRLDAPANRLATELTLQGSERRSGRSVQARLALDYGLRWEPSDGSVRLVQPRVRSLQFADAALGSTRRAELLQRMGITLAERLLDDLVLYRVPEARLQTLRAAGYRPGALQVTPAGLEITIEPLP
ncbi:MAG TPA: hypothetical protein PLB41_18750 [Rubrivivax sp.]|nr:hypothetical protein [Rubrivivax sp.]HPO18958.1 hypothetical protein [Rubrivivax sp.]